MFPFSALDSAVLARIDAVGSDGYDLNTDRIPGTNGAQYQCATAVRSFLEQKKMTGEALRDLNYTSIFQTTHAGQVAVDDLLALAPLNHKLWSIIGVHPEFESYEPQVIVGDPLPANSLIRTDLRFIRPLKSSHHQTQEQQSDSEQDIFAPGSGIVPVTDTKVQYAHTFATHPITTVGQQVGVLMTVTPHTFGARRLVAISYLKSPKLVPPMPGNLLDPLYNTTTLEWPESVLELMIAVTMRILSIKVGDNTTQYVLTKEEENQLLRAIV